MKGKVKFWNSEKHFGFIVPEGGGKDVFVHKSGLSGSLTSLEENEFVEFDTEKGMKGPLAVNVRLV